MATRKRRPGARPVPVRRYLLDRFLKDDLAGYHIIMRRGMTSREILDINAGKTDDSAILAMVTGAVEEHDFDTDDLAELDVGLLADIAEAWGDAVREHAFPPPNAEPSSERSATPTPAT